MPTYDYTCTACGHDMEAFHSMSAMLTTCPSCGQETLRRHVGKGAGLIFKGTGFYQTDYKRSSAPKDKSEGAPAKSASPAPAKTGGGD